jgi:hypothetical protein
MQAGDIKRDPLNRQCPKYCAYQPICRLERSLGVDAEEGEEES